MNADRTFPAKVLLFGEYTVIRGGQALALPYASYGGRWSRRVAAGPAPADWTPLLRFLAAHPELEIDLPRLASDLEAGAGFESDIPRGKGLGSSGALVAALLAHYGPARVWGVEEVKTRLAGLEACYHGQSSGVDPLVSWTASPLLLRGDAPKPVELPLKQWAELRRWFLLDSGVARHSAPLVAEFKRKAQTTEFQSALGELESLVGEGIEAYEHVDEAGMNLAMEALSRLQLSAFAEMVPPSVRGLWEEGLAQREWALKLCGAGGGGFFLGYRLRRETPGDVLFF